MLMRDSSPDRAPVSRGKPRGASRGPGEPLAVWPLLPAAGPSNLIWTQRSLLVCVRQVERNPGNQETHDVNIY